jgi:hypothetical protein
MREVGVVAGIVSRLPIWRFARPPRRNIVSARAMFQEGRYPGSELVGV